MRMTAYAMASSLLLITLSATTVAVFSASSTQAEMSCDWAWDGQSGSMSEVEVEGFACWSSTGVIYNAGALSSATGYGYNINVTYENGDFIPSGGGYEFHYVFTYDVCSGSICQPGGYTHYHATPGWQNHYAESEAF